MFDLGRPWNIWHPLVMWNPHSVMFEVGWCVTLYTTVLALEFSPIVFERFKMTKTLHVLHAVMPILVVLGVLLSTLHQSSLGSFYLIVPTKLHPLWYSPLLPLYFFLTALTLGCAMTIVESFLSHRAFGKQLEMELLVPLGRVALLLLALTSVIRFADFRHRGILGLAFQPTYESRLFLAEMLIGVLAPGDPPRPPEGAGKHTTGLFLAALLIVMGVVMNRMNVSITGMERSSGSDLRPRPDRGRHHALRRRRRVPRLRARREVPPGLPRARDEGGAPDRRPRGRATSSASRSGRSRSRRSSSSRSPSSEPSRSAPTASAGARSRPARPPRPRRNPSWPLRSRASSRRRRSSSRRRPTAPGPVTFRHAAHVDASAPDCLSCHGSTYSFLGRKEAPPAGQMHDAKHCGGCHDGTSAFAIDADCSPCHKAE